MVGSLEIAGVLVDGMDLGVYRVFESPLVWMELCVLRSLVRVSINRRDGWSIRLPTVPKKP